MNEATAGSSGHQSILIPESLGSPIIIDSDSPGTPELEIVWPEPDLHQQGSVTFTPEPLNITARSTVNYDAVDSTIAPWTTRNRVENQTHCSRMNEDSYIRSDTDEVRKISTSNEDMDGEKCPICFDSWDNSGEHRLVALKCGHLFGLKCVKRWLKAQSVEERSCPTCKTKTNDNPYDYSKPERLLNCRRDSEFSLREIGRRMNESTAGSSQGSRHQSILIPESLGSPIIIDSDSPGTPELEIVWPEPYLHQQGSVTFTPEPLNITDNDNSAVATSNVNYDAVDNTIAPWTTRNRVEIQPHCSKMNEDSYIRSDTDEVRKISTSNEDMDGEKCPICFDSWDNSGEHRLVALKCGHLFGLKCVKKWLKAQSVEERSCPTCKTKTKIKNIRYIYARRLVATDASQLTSLQKKIEVLQADKCRVELELQKSNILQLEFLQNTLMQSQAYKEQTTSTSWRFPLQKNLEINENGGCRVMTYNSKTNELYVSQKSTNNLLAGYGIRKISCERYKLGQFVHLHPRPIRDITYSHTRDLLLSVGLDSSARIVERGISSLTVQSGVPLWSCSWDYLRGYEFYVGGVGGVIHQYDVRNPNTFLQRLQAPSDMSPVVSLCSTEYGLLSSQLNSCWLWVANLRQWEPRALPIEGPFMSLRYDNESHRALVSCRPGSNGEPSKMALCKLKTSVPSGEILFETEQTFPGSFRSTLMSRASWVRAPGASWIAAHSESDSTLYLHGLDGARTMTIPAAAPFLDVCSVSLNNDTIVAALSECRLRMYKPVHDVWWK